MNTASCPCNHVRRDPIVPGWIQLTVQQRVKVFAGYDHSKVGWRIRRRQPERSGGSAASPAPLCMLALKKPWRVAPPSEPAEPSTSLCSEIKLTWRLCSVPTSLVGHTPPDLLACSSGQDTGFVFAMGAIHAYHLL